MQPASPSMTEGVTTSRLSSSIGFKTIEVIKRKNQLRCSRLVETSEKCMGQFLVHYKYCQVSTNKYVMVIGKGQGNRIE
jgi:hypothetical protein